MDIRTPSTGLSAAGRQLTPTQTVFQNQCKVVQRGSDILGVAKVNLNLKYSAESIARSASDAQPELPRYTPDGVGVILVFHTETQHHVLGGVRENPALRDARNKDGSNFPLQVTTTLGARLADPSRPLQDAVIEAARGRMLPTGPMDPEKMVAEQRDLLERLCDALSRPEGWEDRVCIHTDKWRNDAGGESTMCYLTAVKHVRCSAEQLGVLQEALKTAMEIKRSQGENTRTLMSFQFSELEPLVGNACDTYQLDETAKAKQAYERYGSKISVTFNDLAVATLGNNGAFAKDHQAAQI